MDRRSFFRSAFEKTSKKVIEKADKKAQQAAQHWIRPPYAIGELDFLLACTRCDACIEACEYDVIFPLASRLGIKVAGTPALDLGNKGCHLCSDWPCVTVCEPKALKLPEPEKDNPIEWPKLAMASINTSTCFPYSGPECGACDICPVPKALIWDQQRPVIDPEHCVGCGLCREVCVVDPSSIEIKTRPIIEE